MIPLRIVLLSILFLTSLTAHPPLETTGLLGSPDPPLPMRVARVFPRLEFKAPIALADLPGRGYRLLLETQGKLLTFSAGNDPESAMVILDLGEYFREGYGGDGLGNCRDFTIDPDFESNGFIYVASNQRPWFVENGTRISRFTVANTDPPSIDPNTRLEIISYPSGDHIGTCVRFGPDGYLYVSAGDGSGPFPPDSERAAQNISDLRGSIIRIDVRGATEEKPYRIPIDNPFVGEDFLRDYNARGEIYSFGFRNAFRIAFNPRSGSLWVADVGWERCEMIHRTVSGGNHGWSLYEGPFPVDPTQKQGPGEIIPPAIVLSRAESQSVTGGDFVSESADMFAGQYLFADYMNGAVWAADLSDETRPTYVRIADSKLRVVSFAKTQLDDRDGVASSLLLDHGGGGIYELVKHEAATTKTTDFPRRLSETGLFESTETLTLAQGAVRYQPAATMWRDGAVGDRVVAIANVDAITASKNRRQYRYPTGTIFANTISREVVAADGSHETRRFETQILAFDGLNWNPYSYAWNDDQTDAELVDAAGADRPIVVHDEHFGSRKTSYNYLSRDQCKVCHHVFMQGGLSFTSQNVIRPTWDELAQEGWVSKFKLQSFEMVDPRDEAASLDIRARSYLEVNCSHCHSPAGGGTSGLHLAADLPLTEMSAINAVPTQGNFEIPDARIISPGHPEQSVLMYRLATTGAGHMPRLGAHTLDQQGATLIWDWIASMTPIDAVVEDSNAGNPRVSGYEFSTSEALVQWRRLCDASSDDAKAEAGMLHSPLSISMSAGLFETWVDPAERVTRVGDRPNIAELLVIPGNAARGRSWFADSGASQCRNCHRYQGVGQSIGPDLDHLVSATTGMKLSREQVLRQLLYPSEEIAPKWRAVTVLTTDGQIVTGLVEQRTDESLTLKQANGQLATLAINNIEDERANEKSLMPEAQLAALTPQELADLLAMLAE